MMRDILVPIALALFITVASLPVVNRLRAHGLAAGLAVTIRLLLDVSGLLVVLGLLVRSLTKISSEIPVYANSCTWHDAHDCVPLPDSRVS